LAIKRKEPVWAYETKQIIGIGADAPKELKLFFGESQVKDVFQTRLVFFNAGAEPIREQDINQRIEMTLHGARILRNPITISCSKEPIQFNTKMRSDGDD
jgi:hypothetical protein